MKNRMEPTRAKVRGSNGRNTKAAFKRRSIKNRFFRFLKFLYLKFFRINDSKQKIALGLGLGVFLGILPGTGPLAALFLAVLLRVNRASALLGSLATNTWLSLVTFLLAVKTGSWLMKLNWQNTYRDWAIFLKDFHWQNLLKMPILKIVLPVLLGYFVVAFALGLVVYLITITILTFKPNENKNRTHLSR